MKPIAFIFGLLASALAFAAPSELGGVRQAVLELWSTTGREPEAGLLLWYLVAGAGAAGGAVVLLGALPGGLLLVAAACGWLALGTVLPAALAFHVAAPLVLCLLAAVVAFAAAGTPKPLPAAARRQPSLADFEREAALRRDLSLEAELRSFHEDPGISPPPRAPVPMLAVANFVLLLGLAGAVGLLYYLELRDPPSPAAAILATTPAPPVAEPAIDPLRTASIDQPDPLQVQPLPPAGLPTAPPATTWSDPFAYCAAVGTIDAPDARYTGPRLPASIADSLGVPAASPVDRARWRCAEGAVLACASFVGPICAVTPSADEMLAFCRLHPGASGLLAPGGTWSCAGAEPVITPGETWLVDPQGFYPRAWVRIAAR